MSNVFLWRLIEEVKRDVIRFVNQSERDIVNAWTRENFLTALEDF
jgi:hypothetical protein